MLRLIAVEGSMVSSGIKHLRYKKGSIAPSIRHHHHQQRIQAYKEPQAIQSKINHILLPTQLITNHSNLKKMSLFRTAPTSGDFGPLFRLLDDYDIHRTGRGQVSSLRSFTPRFDVRETETAYHLDGELPGISQENIDIEFSDHQTLVIKGRTEREVNTTGKSPATPSTPADEDNSNNSDAVQVANKEKTVSNKSDNKPRYWVSERSVGEFHRTFAFPGHVDQDNVQASLNNGILSIVVPKAAAPGSKKIAIA